MLALLLTLRALAAPACDPARTPRGVATSFVELGVAVQASVIARCEADGWQVQLQLFFAVQAGPVLLPREMELYSTIISPDGMTGKGQSTDSGTVPGPTGQAIVLQSPLGGPVGADSRLEAIARLPIVSADGADARVELSFYADLDTHRRRPRLGLRATAQSPDIRQVEGLVCDGPVVGAELARDAVRCLQLDPRVVLTERLPAEVNPMGGQICPDNAVLVALEGPEPCARYSLDGAPVTVLGRAMFPFTLSSELLGWPGPAAPACPQWHVATAIDPARDGLLGCATTEPSLAVERVLGGE